MKDNIKFLPLLFLYFFGTIIILEFFADTLFCWNHGRYIWFAQNLSQGFYSPKNEITLVNGPGYPIALLPLVLLKLPLLTAKLLNPLFLFIAILYFYHTLKLYMHERFALILSYLLGLYPLFMRYIHCLMTETFATFLVVGFIFHSCKLHQEGKNSWAHLLIASIYLGFLALTKIFFGYVILSGILLFLSLYLLKKRITFKKTLLVYLYALLLCVPYLFYTYSLTGKIFYWGDPGGIEIYLMTNLYRNEFTNSPTKGALEEHQEFRRKLEKRGKLSTIQLDDEYKKQAINNIIKNPTRYLKNLLPNIGRFVFNYPYSYDPQKLSTYFYIIPNMFLVVLCVLSLYPAYLGRRLIPHEIHALVLFTLISFVGSSLLWAYNRYFLPLVPLFALWLSFILARIVKVEILR